MWHVESGFTTVTPESPTRCWCASGKSPTDLSQQLEVLCTMVREYTYIFKKTRNIYLQLSLKKTWEIVLVLCKSIFYLLIPMEYELDKRSLGVLYLCRHAGPWRMFPFVLDCSSLVLVANKFTHAFVSSLKTSTELSFSQLTALTLGPGTEQAFSKCLPFMYFDWVKGRVCLKSFGF